MLFWVPDPKRELGTDTVFVDLLGWMGQILTVPSRAWLCPCSTRQVSVWPLQRVSEHFSQVSRLPPSSVQPGESNLSCGISQTLLIVGFRMRHSAQNSLRIWLVRPASFLRMLCHQQQVLGLECKLAKHCMSCDSFSSSQLSLPVVGRRVSVKNRASCRGTCGHLRVSGFQTKACVSAKEFCLFE